MLAHRKHQARFQSDFYRDSYHKILRGLVFSCLIIVLLVLAIIYFILFHPQPSYYATSVGGQIIPMRSNPPTE